MRKRLLLLLILLLPASVALFLYFYVEREPPATSRTAVGRVTTLAGAGRPGADDGARLDASFSDPFAVAVDKEGNVIVADAGQNNRIRRITTKGSVETIAGGGEGFSDAPAREAAFNTPSGLAVDKDGSIIIADTSNNRIRRLAPGGGVSTVAGSGEAGYKDGAAGEAQFDGPIAVALDDQGNIFVADAYNDRIRKIAADNRVSTVAGSGLAGYGDGAAESAMFDTPSGIAVDKQGNIFVADTGNDRIRKITPQGEVITIAGGGPDRAEGQGTDAGLDRPIGILVTHDGFLFVADEGSGRILRITPEAQVSAVAGARAGFADGAGEAARFNSPSGIAMDGEGNLYAADAGNYLIRRITLADTQQAAGADSASPQGASSADHGRFIQPAGESLNTNPDAVIPRLSAAIVGAGRSFLWPLNPQDRWHEVTGVVGEARGAPGGVALHHLHSGLDMRGNMGEPVVSVIDEKVSSPLPAWDFGGPNEGIHVGLMSYIHIRVGRDVNDLIRSPEKFKARYDQSGQLAGVRVRRGTRFKVGDFVGTLNRLYHVHLNFGPWNAQANPIEFPFVAFKDTVAPVIEPEGIEVVNVAGAPFKQKREGRLVISGDVDIVVTAYDRVDGNASQRKLGIYRLGYQLLKEDGSAAAGFEQPLINIEFNRLPPGDESVFVVYAPGSGVSAYGTPTKFRYFATNRVRDGEARDGLLRTSRLPPGNYLLRVIAEDYFGNRASGQSTELAITIEH